jgi:hypothetical protein
LTGTAPYTTVTLTLDRGFYTPSAIASQLQAKIRALDPSLVDFLFSYGTLLGSISSPLFTYGDPGVGAHVFAFVPLTYNSSAYPYPPGTKQLFDLLGFNAGNTVVPENANSGQYTYCQATRYVDIVCNQLTAVSALKDNTSQPVVRDMLCRLYLGDGGGTGQSTTPASAVDISGYTNAFCPPGCAPFTIYRAFPHPKQIQWIPNQNISGFLQFQVYDDAGDILTNSIVAPGLQDTNEYTEWSMSLLVTEN